MLEVLFRMLRSEVIRLVSHPEQSHERFHLRLRYGITNCAAISFTVCPSFVSSRPQ
jgi:hypothetical protein